MYIALAGFFGLPTILAIINGIVLKFLWEWFVVPAFGMKPLNFPISIGIALVWFLFTYKTDPKDETSIGTRVFDKIIPAAIMLLCGFVLSFFV